MCSFVRLLALLPAVTGLSLAPNRVDRAARFLQREGERLGSADLLQLGEEAKQPDGLEKVKKLISHMIAHHQAAQVEDTSHKAFCDKELTASKAKCEKLKAEIQKRKADNDMRDAKLAQIKDNIGDLHSEIANAHKDRKKAADLRSEEAAAYEKNVRDWDAALQALKTKRRLDLTDSEKVREAINKEEEALILKKVKAENKEEDRQRQFKNLDTELGVAIAKKTKDVEYKQRQVVSMNHDVAMGDGDFKTTQEELAAAKDYQEKIKTSCIVRRDPAEQRAEARKQQISSLKDAYEILNGDGVPVLG